jgi:hypothetical protein
MIKEGAGLSRRLSDQAREIAVEVGTGLNGACDAGWSETKPDLSRDCVVAIPNRPAVALVGDSHALALGLRLRKLAAQQNLWVPDVNEAGVSAAAGRER